VTAPNVNLQAPNVTTPQVTAPGLNLQAPNVTAPGVNLQVSNVLPPSGSVGSAYFSSDGSRGSGPKWRFRAPSVDTADTVRSQLLDALINASSANVFKAISTDDRQIASLLEKERLVNLRVQFALEREATLEQRSRDILSCGDDVARTASNGTNASLDAIALQRASVELERRYASLQLIQSRLESQDAEITAREHALVEREMKLLKREEAVAEREAQCNQVVDRLKQRSHDLDALYKQLHERRQESLLAENTHVPSPSALASSMRTAPSTTPSGVVFSAAPLPAPTVPTAAATVDHAAGHPPGSVAAAAPVTTGVDSALHGITSRDNHAATVLPWATYVDPTRGALRDAVGRTPPTGVTQATSPKEFPVWATPGNTDGNGPRVATVTSNERPRMTFSAASQTMDSTRHVSGGSNSASSPPVGAFAPDQRRAWLGRGEALAKYDAALGETHRDFSKLRESIASQQELVANTPRLRPQATSPHTASPARPSHRPAFYYTPQPSTAGQDKSLQAMLERVRERGALLRDLGSQVLSPRHHQYQYGSGNVGHGTLLQ